MMMTRGLAAAAMLCGLAAGTASSALADPPTMNGHYIYSSTLNGQTATKDFYFTPCGDGCAAAANTPGGPATQARLINGQWTLDTAKSAAVCADGSQVPDAVSNHLTWDPNTLAGTSQATINVPACGQPVGYTQTSNLQFRQAP